jgi:hypothetical protein
MFVAPIPIGPFLMDEGGQLSLLVQEPAPVFTFRWHSTLFTVRLSQGSLTIRAGAGRIPSTADGAGKRADALTLLRALIPVVPSTVQLRLLPDYRLQLEAEVALAWPATAAALIAPIVATLFRIAPVLDLLEEEGVRP